MVKITWVATAVDWGDGQVFMGLADVVRARALRVLCAGMVNQCALISTEGGSLPLHLMELRSPITQAVLHAWSDGSREVAIDLPGDERQMPQRSSTLGSDAHEGWVLAVNLSPGSGKQLRELLCADPVHDFASLYGLIRKLAAGAHRAPRAPDQ